MSTRESTIVRGHEGARYPLTVVSLDVEDGTAIHKFQPVFTFKFVGTAIESQDDGEDKQVPRTFIETFDSPVEGTACTWFISPGDEITSTSSVLYSLIEPCGHEIQYGGMCASCGKDLTQGNYLGNAETSRATVAMSHETLGLTVSYSEAARLERETTKRLIQTSKLSLIVDLDQCVIQTTVDPTVGDWLKDLDNPNHAALEDVQHFRIPEEGPYAPIYYVKPRPGLTAFLNAMSRKYEMHIYTMGTKPYAKKIASIIDPDSVYFGSRILSRDENGNHTQKNVQRLFPVETNMVVIIDDRGDVWQWSPNLIKVTPFEFFVGIGDINSSFLPKIAEKIIVAEKVLGDPEIPTALSNVAEITVDTTEMEAAQSAVLEAQMEERPLAKQQAALADQTGNTQAQQLLGTSDDELVYLEKALRTVHERFYQTYNAKIGEITRDRKLAKLNQHKPRRRSRSAPADVKSILAEMKQVVLKGVVVAFSGIIRSDLDPRREWQGQLAIQFGARVLDRKSKELPTHVVVSKDITTANLTEKARLARAHPWIKVVYLPWLLESVRRFERQEEKPFQVDQNAPDVPRPAGEPDDEISESESILTDYGKTDQFIDEASKKMDWNDLQGEMDDFLGDISDDATTEASDNDSDVSTDSRLAKSVTQRLQTTPRHKRMRSQDVSDISSIPQSPLSKRRTMAKQRRSGLVNSVRAETEPDQKLQSTSTQPMASAAQSSESGSDLDDLANELELQLEE